MTSKTGRSVGTVGTEGLCLALFLPLFLAPFLPLDPKNHGNSRAVPTDPTVPTFPLEARGRTVLEAVPIPPFPHVYG
jgi:hypothetical protein